MFALTFFTIHTLKMQNIHLENPTIIGFYAGLLLVKLLEFCWSSYITE